METKVTIKNEISKKQLEANFKKVIDKILDTANHNDWIIKINNLIVINEEWNTIYRIKPDFGNLSKNASKNIAKRYHFLLKKGNMKSMNTLFLVLRKLGIITENVKITISAKEKEINRLRNIYKIMKIKTEEGRLEYKKEKGNFYKEKVAL